MSAVRADVVPATFGRPELAVRLNRSLPAVDRDLACGRIPPGFRIGRRRYWLRDEIDRWLAAGAPPAEQWEAMKKAVRR